MLKLHESPFFADLSFEDLSLCNLNSSIDTLNSYNETDTENDDTMFTLLPNQIDEEWLLDVIRDLCSASGSLARFSDIKSQLRTRGFIKSIPTCSSSRSTTNNSIKYSKNIESSNIMDIINSCKNNKNNKMHKNPINDSTCNENEAIENCYNRIGSPFSQVFTSLGEIGQGGYGKVFKIQNLIDKHQYALKVIDIEPEEASSAMKEVQCLAALNSKRLLRYYSSWIRENDENGTMSLFIQTEFINGQNLAKVLEKRKDVDYSFSLKITKELSKALVDIHTAGIVHRDFNPSNVIITPSGKVKVIDFGISSIKNYDDKASNENTIPPPPPPHPMTPSSLDICAIDRFCINAAETKAKSLAEGTPLYSSPRQLRGVKSTEKDDIYSFGIMIFELFSLFKTQMQKVKEIRALRNEGKLPSEFEEKYPAVSDLIKKMTESHGKERPSAFDILHSDLFAKK